MSNTSIALRCLWTTSKKPCISPTHINLTPALLSRETTAISVADSSLIAWVALKHLLKHPLMYLGRNSNYYRDTETLPGVVSRRPPLTLSLTFGCQERWLWTVKQRLKDLKHYCRAYWVKKLLCGVEVNAVERDLKFLLGNEELRRAVNQGRNSPYDSALM